ncbi:MAG: hypothetical protein PHG02_01290 [Oscillospiraceae bacterium]|nr:hypothetical protein [Oscillospiraceae bacterium]
MSFNTVPFILFLPVVALLYFAVPTRAKNPLLLLASYWFYWQAAGAGYTLLLLCCTAVSYAAARSMEKAQAESVKKRILWVAVLAQIAVLVFFKYSRAIITLTSLPAPTGVLLQILTNAGMLKTGEVFSLLFPLGISFYTFTSLGYLFDVSSGATKAEKDFIVYSLFVSFFAYITAGPIGRAGKLLPQLHEKHCYNYSRTVQGLQLMALGYFKKIAVADMIAKYINVVYADVSAYTGLTLVFSTVLYSVYLYCDFSGYSDIARGCAKILGFDLTENFNTPYFSTSFSQFWERWHISLSSWLQDYLFTPLIWSGWQTKLPFIGKYLSGPPMLAALAITFLVSGIWHGNTVNYVLWGACHAVYRIGETLMRKYYKKPDKHPSTLKRTAKTLWVFSLVTFSYIFFRSVTVSDAFYVIANQFKGISISGFVGQSIAIIQSGFSTRPPLMWGYVLFCAAALAIAVYMDVYRCFTLKGKCLTTGLAKAAPIVRWTIYYVLIGFICVAFIMQSGNFGGASFAYAGF